MRMLNPSNLYLKIHLYSLQAVFDVHIGTSPQIEASLSFPFRKRLL